MYIVSYIQFIDQSGEADPAACSKPDSPEFSYVEFTLRKLFFILNRVFEKFQIKKRFHPLV
ncbi:hypothetical protein LEP1GSC021_2831 [Leptospira noguchii str. 1993005606]|uniref:Uncharacterized protein n=1 Tax=Leptospira noguchii str. 2007001578 TaxID=1049974 RepID=A0ABN0IY66_9LEPT|nr:hypothetical protein LEP1GSC035_1276 [Leptospira noguchii str. 2007001578]EPE85095.1 hypothetical protein LEP1GSC021_2831 [Leptospira noguchii str. 1993005606]